MSLLRVARPGLGRVMSNSVSRRQVRTISHANSSPKPTVSSSSKAARLTAAAGIVSAPCLWWLLTPSDEAPRYSNIPAERFVVETGPSQEEVTQILSKNSYSFRIRGVPGVSRYDGAQLAANNPCEDRATHGSFPSPWDDGSEWMAWGVFDGHSGWVTADLLEKQLLSFVRRFLGQAKPNTAAQKVVPDEMVQSAVKKGFLSLDDAILKTAADVAESKEPLQDKVKKLAVAYAGSCALLSIFDPATSTLHVACTGDSRAVLAQQGEEGQWEMMFITKDQEGKNEEEAERIRKEHPGEEKVVEGGRVLGMMATRVFGDARWKWPLELQREFSKRFYGDSPLTPRYEFKTPPYLTAEPVVTSIKVDRSKPSFLIMATDGFWYYVSTKQAVDLTGQWLDTMQAVSDRRRASTTLQPTYEPFDFSHFEKGVRWRDVEGRTTVEDKNIAVHLMRNAVGGNHRELVAGRLAFTAPNARRRRDDITVQVVLFNT
ncbi:phosphatase 2C-like domain-containing protein [Triangularia verruculosa]|uniref:Phosphatase 2C-like domain-containing protein n=1 Tax=Triangularia verruculosa TaxID=2587418 RepID=A0AAN6X5F7_9PEZI|nr:phosphatase 2C-like domain-containing protein [Triangularia verruculosa]